MTLATLNEKLPDNVCVTLLGIHDFHCMLEKLSDIWTGVITPNYENLDYIPWVFAYLLADFEDTKNYIIWFFNYDLEEQQIVEEIEHFLSDEREEPCSFYF